MMYIRKADHAKLKQDVTEFMRKARDGDAGQPIAGGSQFTHGPLRTFGPLVAAGSP